MIMEWAGGACCGGDPAATASTGVKKKPSSCLKEVEKIKQKREERRAAHAALREQLDQEYDTTVPNWEFGAMIRSVYNCTLTVCPVQPACD